MLPKRTGLLLLISAWVLVVALCFYAEAQPGLDEFQHGQMSRVHGSGLGEHHSPQAGQEVIVLLELILDDGHHERSASHFEEAGIGTAHLNITGPEKFSVPFQIVDGKIQAMFEYTLAGYYQVQVRIGDQALDKVHALTVTPGPVDASSAWVMVVEHGDEAGDELLFKVKFWDKFRNPLSALDIAKDVTFYGSKVAGRYTSPRGSTKEDSISFGEGLTIESLPFQTLFVGRFKPTMAGDWRVSLVVNSVAVEEPAWPPMVLPPGRLDAAGCAVEGMGASFMREAGHEYVLKIVPGDVHGNEVVPERPEMGYGCSVDVTWHGSDGGGGSDDGPDEVAAEVGQKLLFHEVSNAYVLTFQPMRAGTLSIEARVLGKEIPDSPMKVMVLPGVADANETSLASTECRRLDNGMAGVETAAVIVARDKYGNSAWHSHDPFRAGLFTEDGAEAEGAEVSLESLGDGNYSLAYMVPSPGSFRLEVTLYGSHVQGSPAAVTSRSFQRSGRAAAENTAAELVDAEVAAGLPMGFLLHLKDTECYPAALPDKDIIGYILELYTSGTFGDGAPPQLEIELLTSPTEGAADVTDPVLATAMVSAAGSFDAVVYAAEAGVRTALASMPGKPWPLRVEVLPAEPATGTVVLVGYETGVVVAGSAAAVNITLLDEFGNELLPRHVDPLRPLLDLVVEHTGGEEQEVPGYSGNKTTSFNVTMAGEVMMHVMLDGQRLPGGQKLLVAAAAPHPGRGVSSGNVTTVRPQQEGQIYLSLLDAYGNEAALPAQLECEASVTLELTPNIPAPGYGVESAVSSCGPGSDEPMNNSVVIRFSINSPNVTLAHLSIRLTGANGWEDSYSFAVEVGNSGFSGENGASGLLSDDSANPEEQKGSGFNTAGLVIGGVVAAVMGTVLAGALYVWMGRRRARPRGSQHLPEFFDKDSRAECDGFIETTAGDEESPATRQTLDDGDEGGLDSSLSKGLIKAGATASDSQQAREALVVRDDDARRFLLPNFDTVESGQSCHKTAEATASSSGPNEAAASKAHQAGTSAADDAPSQAQQKESESSLLISPSPHSPGKRTILRDSRGLLLVNSCTVKAAGEATPVDAQVEVEEEIRPPEARGKSTVGGAAPAGLSSGSLQHLPQLPRIPPLRLSQNPTSSAPAPSPPPPADCPEVLINPMATRKPQDDTARATKRDKDSISRASRSVLGEGFPLSLTLPQISPSRSRQVSASSDSRESSSAVASARPGSRAADAPEPVSAEKQQALSLADGSGSTAAAETDLKDSQEGWEGGPPVLALLEQMMTGDQASKGTSALLPGIRPPRHVQDLPPLPRLLPRSKPTSSAVTGQALLPGPQPPAMPTDAVKDCRRISSTLSSHAVPSASSSVLSLGIPGQLPSQEPPIEDPESSSDGQLPGSRSPAAARSSEASSCDHDGPNETDMGVAENGGSEWTDPGQGSVLSISSALTPPRSDEGSIKRPPRAPASSIQQVSPAPLIKSNTMPSRPRRRAPGSTVGPLADPEAPAPATSRPSTRSSVFDSLGSARPRRNTTNSAVLVLGGTAVPAGAQARTSSGGETVTSAGMPLTARHELSTQAWQDRSELPSFAAANGGKPPVISSSSSRPRRRGQQQQQQQQEQQQQDEEPSPSNQRQVAWDKTSGPSSKR